jgi:large subunit ribosomal protein L5
MNPMREIRIEKLTLNMGAGKDEEKLKKSIKLLELISGVKVVKTFTTKRIPGWGLRPGLPLGCKTTIRGKRAEEILKRLLLSKENRLKPSCFDDNGNVAFGIDEYINIPDMKYDPSIGMLGFQACITLARPGFCIKIRRLRPKKISSRHKINKQDAIAFMKERFQIKVGDEE